jgi:hypothetical protein
VPPPEQVEIRLLPDPVGGQAGADGPVRSVQAAELEVPAEFVATAWRPENLERLARAYWAYLERISLHVLRVGYEPASRTVMLLSPRLPLLRFRRPQYVTARDLGQVTWPIERGVLVSPSGRGRGFLRITIRRSAAGERRPEGEVIRIEAEVANFYPGLRLGGRFARLGAWLYNQTQVRLHRVITRGFLRSLTRLELQQPASRPPVGSGPPRTTPSPRDP